MNAILKYGLLTFLVAVVALALGVLAGKYAAEASTGFAGNLRDAMYENIQHYSFSNIDKFSTAGLVTRMTTDVTVMLNAVNAGLRPLVRSPVMLCMGLAMACVLSPRLTIVFRRHNRRSWPPSSPGSSQRSARSMAASRAPWIT